MHSLLLGSSRSEYSTASVDEPQLFFTSVRLPSCLAVDMLFHDYWHNLLGALLPVH